jgi:hypothetical protein
MTTGSFNPIHRSHARMAVAAKQHLESIQPDTIIVAAVFSPSHERYVSNKLGHEFIDTQHRLQMCQLALSSEPALTAIDPEFASVDSLEATHLDRHCAGSVCGFMQERLDILFGKGTFEVVYFCGMDYAVKCQLFRGGHWCHMPAGQDSRQMDFVAVSRPGYEIKPSARGPLGNIAPGVLESVDLPGQDGAATVSGSANEIEFSSTCFRLAVSTGDLATMARISYPEVIDYMRQHGIYGFGRAVGDPSNPSGEPTDTFFSDTFFSFLHH